ncbi:LysR family transcriptional regulator [Aurantimonas sp. A2-1-M11]|uniref:LysR family transcriptional regulator n=1 Tax=Aurantimonas sp. A2-1-M11 TaxID=3113712 RepID=UPI002F920E3F
MEMHQIRYALAVARAGSFTKAAEGCNASQPALSKAVKALEAKLGSPLFHREGKKVLTSEFGRSMLPHLQRIVDEAEVTQMGRVPTGGVADGDGRAVPAKPD